MSGSFVHNSIIAGCRCLAGHLPSSPTKRDTMPLGDHVAPSSTSRRLITMGLTASLAAALLAVISITGEDDKRALTTPEPIESSSSAATRSTTTPRPLVSRLGRSCGSANRPTVLGILTYYARPTRAIALAWRATRKQSTSCCGAPTCGMGSRLPSR